MKPAERIANLDTLRGIACLGVCWFHLTNDADGWLKSSGKYGWLGVPVFFVISGFILPYSLYHANYQINQYGRFLLKRLIRLEPPYLASLCLGLLIPYLFALRPGFQGQWPQFSLTQIVLHFGYLNTFSSYDWVNGAYWTLAIELQYYLLIGLTFAGIAHKQARWRWLTLGLLYCASWLPLGFLVGNSKSNSWQSHEAFLLSYWLPLFTVGIAIFQHRVGFLRRGAFLLVVVLLEAGAFWCTGSGPVTTCAALAVIAIYWLPSLPGLHWLGSISYSLYLVHLPLCDKTVYLLNHFPVLSPLSVRLIALVVSIGAAWLLHAYCEKPSQRIATRCALRQ